MTHTLPVPRSGSRIRDAHGHTYRAVRENGQMFWVHEATGCRYDLGWPVRPVTPLAKGNRS